MKLLQNFLYVLFGFLSVAIGVGGILGVFYSLVVEGGKDLIWLLVGLLSMIPMFTVGMHWLRKPFQKDGGSYFNQELCNTCERDNPGEITGGF